MQINIIAACDPSGIIGVNNRLPWAIKEDLQRFRELTLGHAVIMGRNTWLSLGGNPLPGRECLVISSDGNFHVNEWTGYFACWNMQDAIDGAEKLNISDTSWIIGGERLYSEALPLADRVYLTLIEQEVEVGPDDTVARFPMEQMQDMFRIESSDKRDGFRFTEWVRNQKSHDIPGETA